MGIGRAIGYSLLALVDAVVPTVAVLAITGFTLLGRELPGVSGVTVTLVAGAVTFGLTLLASAISHARGGSPFAFTRLSKVVVYYWLVWPPWTPFRRRRR